MEEIYKSKKLKMIGLFIFSVLLTIGGIFTMFTNFSVNLIPGIVITIVFGFSSIFFFIAIIKSPYLKLNEKGFEFKIALRKSFVNWKDVEIFYVTTIYSQYGVGSKFVGIKFSDSYKHEIVRNIARAIGGSEGMLPDNYGKKPKELANIMNSWKKRFG